MTNFIHLAFKKSLRSASGFTLIETLVAIAVFAVVIGVATSFFFDAFSTNRKTEASRIVYEESRIALERIVKEVRRGTVDYEEYWSQHNESASNYGEHYGDYARQFYRDSNGYIPEVNAMTRADENVGVNGSDSTALESAITKCALGNVPIAVTDNSGHTQCELYLITADGTEKTIIKVLPEKVNSMTEYRLEMLKLAGSDSDSDGQIDAWSPMVGFGTTTAQQFVKIQPDSIKITNLQFVISPLEDSRKAFADYTNDIQIQPHVTIFMTVRPSGASEIGGVWKLAGIKGEVPEISLQTTISSRAQNEVKSLPF